MRYRVASCLAKFYNCSIAHLSEDYLKGNDSEYTTEKTKEWALPNVTLADEQKNVVSNRKASELDNPKAVDYPYSAIYLTCNHYDQKKLDATSAIIMRIASEYEIAYPQSHFLIVADAGPLGIVDKLYLLTSWLSQSGVEFCRLCAQFVSGVKALMLSDVKANYGPRQSAVMLKGQANIALCALLTQTGYWEPKALLESAQCDHHVKHQGIDKKNQDKAFTPSIPSHRKALKNTGLQKGIGEATAWPHFYSVAVRSRSYLGSVLRHVELTQLQVLAERLLSTQEGAFIQLLGSAGSGKSFLLSQFNDGLVSSLGIQRRCIIRTPLKLINVHIPLLQLQFRGAPAALLLRACLSIKAGASDSVVREALGEFTLDSVMSVILLQVAGVSLRAHEQSSLDAMPGGYRLQYFKEALMLCLERLVKGERIVFLLDGCPQILGRTDKESELLACFMEVLRGMTAKCSLLVVVAARAPVCLNNKTGSKVSEYVISLRALSAHQCRQFEIEIKQEINKLGIATQESPQHELANNTACITGGFRCIQERLWQRVLRPNTAQNSDAKRGLTLALIRLQQWTIHVQTLTADQQKQLQLMALIVGDITECQIVELQAEALLYRGLYWGWFEYQDAKYRWASAELKYWVLANIPTAFRRQLHHYCAAHLVTHGSDAQLYHRAQGGEAVAWNQWVERIEQLLSEHKNKQALALLECCTFDSGGQVACILLVLKARCLMALHQQTEGLSYYQQAFSLSRDQAFKQSLQRELQAYGSTVVLVNHKHNDDTTEDSHDRYERLLTHFSAITSLSISDQQMHLLLTRKKTTKAVGCQSDMAQEANKYSALAASQYNDLALDKALNHAHQATVLASVSGNIAIELSARITASEVLMAQQLYKRADAEILNAYALAKKSKDIIAQAYIATLRVSSLAQQSSPEAMQWLECAQDLMDKHNLEPILGSVVWVNHARLMNKNAEVISALDHVSKKIVAAEASVILALPTFIQAAYQVGSTRHLSIAAHYFHSLSGSNLPARWVLYKQQSIIAQRAILGDLSVKALMQFNDHARSHLMLTACLVIS